MRKPSHSAQRTIEILSHSQMYRDYEHAFTEGTGLPLRLQLPTVLHLVSYAKDQENPFCAMLAKTGESCARCYSLLCKVEEEAQFQAKTLQCFAGLCETAVPVRVGAEVIAFLHTGQVLLQQPDTIKFQKIAATLLEWGSRIDLKKLEEHYFHTPVLPIKQYEALIRLLEIFARHLAECGMALAPHETGDHTPAMTRARSHIRDHSEDEMSLITVGKVANMSATYFSEKFKEATGINFVEYVARTRVEKARNLLLNSQWRISEVAYDVGFQSLSQFNRAFRRIAGETPRDYRARL